MADKIDFVIIWVDGNDPEWRRERSKYEKKGDVRSDSSEHRYRDWDNMQYWFRGVEKFCPWVNRVHFVTWGHLPAWLNTGNPKLNIVNHKDYIPSQYLPTFSSHTIELNLHRIDGLTDQFVYFNDDTFVIDEMKATDFFVEGKPCDSAILTVHCYDMDEMFVLAPFRDIGIINHEFYMRDVIRKNFKGWFNYRYGKENLRNLFLSLSCPRFPGILQLHLPAAYIKSTFEDVWENYAEILDETCSHKFREISDVNQWVFKEWQLASGNFFPRKVKIGASIPAYHIDDACEMIRRQRRKMLCLNDTEMSDEEFKLCVSKVNASFEAILPEKSSFEK